MATFIERLRRWALPIAAVAFVAAAAGCAYSSARTAQSQTPLPARSQELDVYFLRGEQFERVARRAAPSASAPVAAIRALLAGPTAAERARGIETTIPKRTTLASVEIDGETATVKLNGVATAATALDVSLRPARAAQVVYTLTSIAGIERVTIEVDGTRRAAYVGSKLMTKGVLDQGELSNPVRLSRQPATVPSGPAPVHVIGVQKRLQELRYLPADGASGTWDDRTRHAVIAFQGWQGLARDGIVGPQTIAALEASGPPRPSTGGSASRIEVHRAKGVVLLIEGSQVIRAVHSSAGAPGYETPTGSYSVFRKERNSWSVPYQVWLPYASYFNAGIALHGYADVPAHPASHGCVRVPTSEAPSVYEFAAVGTQVTVF